MKKSIYISYLSNPHLLKECTESIWRENQSRSTKDCYLVTILNDSMEFIPGLVPFHDYEEIIPPPVKLVNCQMIEWANNLSIERDEKWMIAIHSDAYLYPGALDAMDRAIAKADQIGINTDFIKKEGSPFDPILFPLYFEDNHFHSIMKSTGWSVLQTENYGNNAFHYGSMSIKSDPILNRINGLQFSKRAEIYKEIWGGLPGEETRIGDRTAGGTRR